MGYRVVNGKLYPVENLSAPFSGSKSCYNDKEKVDVSFKKILEKAIDRENGFNISNHASKRLESRKIKFSEKDMEKINSAINKAREKDGRECLILYKDTALITNIKNRTIITAVPKEEMSVFTNLDTVVLI
ncbi:TIGR02530 family flagellar biosynthesis protein [Clostridium sp. KNHs214]|uniref:TIGR02530 family flagellar biosynthesis protein n=1 Tax=Clostridium sp. KNHs214 TaxID=1540257 RepID=UPI00055031D1|nr:TIGR02530 family flagellar biosynthesis protein [Clostridium sp. KNHs214]